MTFSDGTMAELLRAISCRRRTSRCSASGRPSDATSRKSTASPGSPAVVIVSHGFWQQRLGGPADAIGRPIRLDGADYTRHWRSAAAAGSARTEPGVFHRPAVLARRHDAARSSTRCSLDCGLAQTRSAAAEELRAINKRIFPIWKTSYQDDKATWSMMDLKTHVVGDVSKMAGLALAAVALVWLIACTNASNLLIARVTSRRRELAVRAALGASRGRVVRYLLAESSVLAVGSVVVGVVFASLGVQLLRGVGANYFPRMQEIALDGPVLWLLVGLTITSGLMFGLVPALHGTGGPVDDSLRSSGRSATGSLAVRRLRRVLVGSQFAVATPLLVVAGLLLASLNELRHVDLGFDSRNVRHRIDPPAVRAVHGAGPRRVRLGRDSRTRSNRLPGVAAVAFADGRPPNNVGNINNFDLEESPDAVRAVSTRDAVGRGHAEYFRRARPHAARGAAARRPRCADARISNPSWSIARGHVVSFPREARSASGSAKAAARRARGPASSAS